MKKQQKLILSVLAVLALGVFFFVSFFSNQLLIGDGIAVYRTQLGGSLTTQGFMYVPFVKQSDKFSFVNIGLDINGDGVIVGYDTPLGYQEEWVVQNDFPEILNGEANRFPIDIIDPTFGTKPISGVAVLSKVAFEGGTWSRVHEQAERQKKEFTVTSVIPDVRDVHMSLDTTGKLATGYPEFFGMTVAHAHEEPTVAPAPAPSNDDYYWFHADVPDQNQLWNECAPTAISNSLRWFAKEYKLEDRMPKGDVNDLIDEIKGDVAWNDGAAHDDIIAGKRTFAARHNLPIDVHQIGTTDDPQIIQKINAELEKGQAVEAWLSFYNASGTPAGAHLVTVVGAGHKNGKDIIRFTDPDTIGAPSRDAYDVEAGNMIPRYWPGSQTYITYAYAQSPTKEFVEKTWVDPRNKEAISAGGGAHALTPPEEDLTLSRSQFGFFSVSVGHPGDHYVGESFPVRATVFKTGKSRTMHYADALGHDVAWTHSAEYPWTLSGAFVGGGAIAPTRIENAPPTTGLQSDRFSVEQNFTCTSAGFATVAYSANIGWTHSGDVPPEVKQLTHGTEFESTEDKMYVESPAFRCIAVPVAQKEDSRTTVTQSFCPDIAEDPNGKEIDVLKAGGECYPTLQFHQAHPDKCDAVHWHANMGSARSLRGTTWIDPSGCGFGKISEVQSGKVKLSPDQAAPFIDEVKK